MLKNRGQIGVILLILAHCSQTMVILSANIQDLKNLARRFVPGVLETQITDFIQKYATKTPESKMSEENEANLKKYMELKLSDDEYTLNDSPEKLPQLQQINLKGERVHPEAKNPKLPTYQQRTKEDNNNIYKTHQKNKKEALRIRQKRVQEEKSNISNKENNRIQSEDLTQRNNVESLAYSNEEVFTTKKSTINEEFSPTHQKKIVQHAKFYPQNGVGTLQTVGYPTRTRGWTGRMQHEAYDKPKGGQKRLTTQSNGEKNDEFQTLEIPIKQLLQIIEDLKDEEEILKHQKKKEQAKPKYGNLNKEVENQQNKQHHEKNKQRTMKMMKEIAKLDKDRLQALKEAVDNLEKHTKELYNVIRTRRPALQ